jgi:hypothetical protein
MADSPFRKKPGKARPDIWASGGQRPPFDLRALGRASLFLSRTGVAFLQAWAARTSRRVAINVRNGAGRIPAEKLGRAARLVPSHSRVAGWIKNVAATLAHASASADPDIKRGNALVAQIEPHLWSETAPLSQTQPDTELTMATPPETVAPVVLSEPMAEADPLASIRGDIAGGIGRPRAPLVAGPDNPPMPPGPFATAVIQVAGYLIGWTSVIIALPYGLARSLWQWVNGRDLKTIGRED